MNNNQTAWQRLLSGVNGFNVSPVKDTELAEFYWCTDLKTSEISAAFCEGVHNNKVSEMAGPAIFGPADCKRCSNPIYVFSRSDAERRFNGISDGNIRADWARPEICKPCSKALYDKRFSYLDAKRRQRAERERELKSMPYGEYLKTVEWQETRRRALHRAKYCCQTCSSKQGLQVHHRTYARRGAEWSSDLTVLCEGCHSLFHENACLSEGGRAA